MTKKPQPAKHSLVLRAQEIEARSEHSSHPWNPRSSMRGLHLSGVTGLTGTGVSHVILESGCESFILHRHHYEDEWVFILEGRGLARLDEQEFELAAGDFIAYPAGGPAHHLRNPFDQPLRYLMGGACREVEVAEFPEQGKLMLREGDRVRIFATADEQDFGPPESRG